MITSKPKRQPSESGIRKHISRASIAAVEKHSPKNVQLRLPHGLLARIDQVIESRPVKVPRHTWFLEAITTKLEGEEPTLS